MTEASTVDAHHPDVSGIIDRLESVHRTTGHGIATVFRDWVGLMVDAFARDDPSYLDRLERYDQGRGTGQECAETFSEAFGELMRVTMETQRPVLGIVYEEVGARADALGQHFTPWTVCKAKADMVIDEATINTATEDDPLTVADPACGSGRLLVAAAKTAFERDATAPVLVRGTDKDQICAQMTVINLVLANTPGRVRHGDSITREIHQAWDVVPGAAGPPVVDVDVETPPEAMPGNTDPGAAGRDTTESAEPRESEDETIAIRQAEIEEF